MLVGVIGWRLNTREHPLQVLKALGDALDAVLASLELDGAVAVVACALEDLEALLYVHVALAYDGALEVVTAAGLAEAGGGGGGLIHILGVDVDGVGGHAGDGGTVVLVGADEVAHVHQKAVVIVGHGVEKLLHAVGVLGDVAVVLGAGLDALVAQRMQRYKRLPLVSGSMAYNIALVKTFLGKLGINMKVTADGKPFSEGSLLFAICANAPVYGGGYISAPNARIADGLLDCVTIETVSKLKFLKLLPIYKGGRHEGIDVCNMGKCKSFEFRADRVIPVSLDGEIIHTDNFACEIVEKAINFVVPKGINLSNC